MSKTILKLWSQDWKSLYVDEIPMDLELDGVSMTTEESLKDYFENKLAVGEVSDVEIFKKNQDTICCIIHFRHWYKNDRFRLRYRLNRLGYHEFRGYMDSDRVYHKFKSNRPYWNFSVSINFTEVPDDVVDTSKVDLTNTIEVEEMFELMSDNESLYATRIEEQENIMDKQRAIIENLLKEKRINWAKKNSGKKV